MTSSGLINFYKLLNKFICGLTDNQIEEIVEFLAQNLDKDLSSTCTSINDGVIDELLQDVDFDDSCFSEISFTDKPRSAHQAIPHEELDKRQESAVPRSTARSKENIPKDF